MATHVIVGGHRVRLLDYTDNFYWRFYGGTWYRSNVYSGGWTVYNDVPYSVRHIERPHEYAHYRPSGYVP